SVEDGDPLDLHQEVRLCEALHDDQRVGGIGGRRKHLVPRGGDQGPIGPVRDVRGGLHEMAEASAVMGEDRREVLVALSGLGAASPRPTTAPDASIASWPAM